MALPTPPYTIQQTSGLTGLSVHTLRYYERIALLAPIGRADNGHRRFSEGEVERIKLLSRMLETKMPLEDIRRYAALVAEGEASIPERGRILSTHREKIVHQLAALQETLTIIDRKLTVYQSEACDPPKVASLPSPAVSALHLALHLED